MGSISPIDPQPLAPLRCSINGDQVNEILTPRKGIKPGQAEEKVQPISKHLKWEGLGFQQLR